MVKRVEGEKRLLANCVSFRDHIIGEVVHKHGFISVQEFYAVMNTWDKRLAPCVQELLSDIINRTLQLKQEQGITSATQTILTYHDK